jgi:ABC-type Zn uptake system ZnuABC Zn-binding protein ZnuA
MVTPRAERGRRARRFRCAASLRGEGALRGSLLLVLRASAALLGLCIAFHAQAAPSRPLVVATTPDLKSIAEAVSAGAVRAESLVPAGGDAEAFEPRPSQLALVRDAVLVLRIGLGYDEWLDRLLKQSANARVQRGGEGYLDLSADIALVEVQGRSIEASSGHAHGAANPHYWLDPLNAEIMSAQIAEALTRVVPEAREAIAAAQRRFVIDLKAGVARWSAMLAPYRGAPLVAYHNAWPYFARRFRLNIVDVIEPKEGVPPSLARLAALAARMREAGVRVVLREPSEPIDAPRFLADRSGARVITLAPSVGATPEAKDLPALFESNVQALAKALAERP